MTSILPESRTGLRPGIRWVLGLTLCACAWAWWWPATDQRVIGLTATQERRPPVNEPVNDTLLKSLRLPDRLVRGEWPESDEFDPFVGVVAPPPPPRVAPAPIAVVVTPPPPPRLEARFVGRVVSPDGQDVVYLAWRDLTVSASVGQPAGEGYLVEAIGNDAVTLHHAADGLRIRIAIPAANPLRNAP